MPIDRTVQQICDAMPWPLPLRETVGQTVNVFTDDPVLICLNVAAATAPDGHDVQNDPAMAAYHWRITSMSPPAGTLVPETQAITLKVIRT